MENENDFTCKKNECCWYGYCLLVDPNQAAAKNVKGSP
jgi:hypothetical protein